MSEQNIPEHFDAKPGMGDKPVGVWIALMALGVITLIQLISALSQHSGGAFVTALFNIALMVGLARGYKWAYVVLIVFSIGGAIFAFGKSAQQGLIVLLGNAVVLGPILLSTNFFFAREQESKIGAS